jgi:hypothetical protein
MARLQVKLCLVHDLIDVYWTSIEARNGFTNYKYFCESRFLPRLQIIVQHLDPELKEVTVTDLTEVYNMFCRRWDQWFEQIDCWNTTVVDDENPVHLKMYEEMKELSTDLRMLAYHMKPNSDFESSA